MRYSNTSILFQLTPMNHTSFDGEELREEENPVEVNLDELLETLRNLSLLTEKLEENKPIVYPPAKLLPDDFDIEQYLNIKKE